MNRLMIALAASALLSTGALAQTSETSNPVPATSAGEESAMPADAASTVIVPGDAPAASTAANTSTVPVPGNDSGIGSTMPAEAASTVVVPTDATPVPADTSVPVPGTSAGDDTTVKTN
ncbi:hypothetical protein D3218_00720 [Aureimonas flava]|uniref:Uncharacterized protein n=1 Tax=Aureimonas flava TaxID=2320271 RepID=A0A3A1WRM0_9HYPH|nr:hypothetical protein [Aureimonas flava]RIY03325.1 hypothetical protein D3218_00720 [Aureimonas flava]